MIKSFKHKGLEKFYLTGSIKGIQAEHTVKLRRILTALSMTSDLKEFKSPNYRLHQLKGKLKGLWSVTVNGNWRIIFEFEDENAYIVDYLDYH
ncbi:MAG: type II toxin-antitoxin system RelE/ParE family toxin [Heliobacteriaceae bacterium]|jgi:proteic killer suppression protein|nr:type II toxin-antitoxin system RelE/ParE family toxin [Heliobacteriaceae bacterium]